MCLQQKRSLLYALVIFINSFNCKVKLLSLVNVTKLVIYPYVDSMYATFCSKIWISANKSLIIYRLFHAWLSNLLDNTVYKMCS